MKLKLLVLFLSLITAYMLAPVAEGKHPVHRTGAASPGNAQTEEAGKNDFAFKLFRNLSRNSNKNILISPLSAQVALSMTMNGAAGKTLSEMESVLGVPTGALSKFNSDFHNNLITTLSGPSIPSNIEQRRELLQHLNARLSGSETADELAKLISEHRNKLNVANAIFADMSSPFKPQFTDVCSKKYMAEAQNFDFNNSEATAKVINAWCSQKTNNKIQSIIDDSTVKTSKMVLVSAVYFKAAWNSTFDKISTKDESFTTTSGSHINVKMMHQKNDFDYFRGENFQSIAMPYLRGRKLI